ncbi:tRNA (adenosine(37)-N6)-dimethylallyltransferase MiaA [Helicobacter sp. 11S02629-2]|uniref:tRNA (adenosine(37)-N6)-dimethylallyltransferase MiaA n=1 Tax=Helicobacter sp. 11S02629-2 TaxID=1476195 RepID=UPI000BA5E0DE|nr:tRNA (adenosine(37)-N6)-dimethylallyltransferase MiaA [Helicobacter sp. 11S02629-2]PAF44093.1 tRNA (adenosine(37)-N6)-dimethylallyltransferase MiaA [Helicobacter sp. 11S02629-2]
MELVALVGPSGSGKTKASIKLAKMLDANIFSLDSLSVFKYVDIASAKPTLEEREGIRHFGIDVLPPSSTINNAGFFATLLDKALMQSLKQDKPLVIVGGSSFFLKAILCGLSPSPKPTKDSIKVYQDLESYPLEYKYKLLSKLDYAYMQTISPQDTYRVNKALELYIHSRLTPSEYFKKHPPKKFKHKVHTFTMSVEREALKEKIRARTKDMIERGLVYEAEFLLKKYGENIYPFKTIGLKESLSYLKGELDLQALCTLISANTIKLAKRQSTFNKTQFDSKPFSIEDALKVYKK